MDSCIRTGVTSLEPVLPGPFKVRRRAPGLYRRLQKGFYPTVEINRATSSDLSSVNPDGSASTEKGIAKRVGRADHPLQVVPFRTTPVFPGIEYLSCMAIAVNEVNAAGGRVVTAPLVILSGKGKGVAADLQDERCRGCHSCNPQIRDRVHIPFARTRVSRAATRRSCWSADRPSAS